MYKKLTEINLIILILLVFMTGCRNNSQNNEVAEPSPSAVLTPIAEPTQSVVLTPVVEPTQVAGDILEKNYTQKSKEAANIDINLEADAVQLFCNMADIVVEATFVKKIEDKVNEVEFPNGAVGNTRIEQNCFTLNEVVRNNVEKDDFSDEIIVGIGSVMGGIFPDLHEGDRVIFAIRDSGIDNEQEYYIWDITALFYIKSDGTIFSAFIEDNKYDGLEVEEFKKLIIE